MEAESERIGGADRDYCSDCVAKREAQVAGLSHDIEEVVERRQAETVAAPIAHDARAPGAWWRPLAIAAVVVVLIGAAIGARMVYRPVTDEMTPSGEGAEGVAAGERPSVGGSWGVQGQRAGQGQRGITPVSRQPGRRLPSGAIDPDVWSLVQEASRETGSERSTTGQERPSSAGRARTSPSRDTGDTDGGDTEERDTDDDSPSSTETTMFGAEAPGSPGDQMTPNGAGEGAENGEEGPVEQPGPDEEDLPPEVIVFPDMPPPGDGDEPFIPRELPDEIVIPIPPPE
ncbi:MAG: hypothetical protein PVH68_08975 [Armatimonadota bacterium]